MGNKVSVVLFHGERADSSLGAEGGCVFFFFIAQVPLRGKLHCVPEIVGDHPCSGDYTLIHHCNLNNDFIQKKRVRECLDLPAAQSLGAVGL